MNKNVRLTIRLTDAQRRDLEAIADHRQVSVSEVVRSALHSEIALDDYLRDKKLNGNEARR